MVRDELSVLSAFLAAAEERSFTRAAKRLGVSASALSHAIRGLEEQIGVRLLARTTRSVAPTEAGDQLLARLRPALGDIRGALDQVSGLRDQPAGRVRLVVSPLAATMLLAPKLGQFARDYPDVVLDVTTTNEGRFDLVAGRFDAGIHLGEFIERDMIAVRVSPDQRAAIVGSPRYFESHAKPNSPHDLTDYRCLNFRHGSEGVYRWEFDQGHQSLAVAVNGPLIVDDAEIMIRAAVDGVGLAFMLEAQAAPHLARGALVRVLED
jgi:DNA-binding transcriptional LysR family regulator